MVGGQNTIWNLNELRELSRFPAYKIWMGGLAFFADGTLVSTGRLGIGDEALAMRTWSAGEYRSERTIPLPANPTALAVSSQDRITAALRWGASPDMSAQLIDVQSEETLFVIPTASNGHEYGKHTSIDFAPDGSLLAIGTELGFITLWDFSNGAPEIVATALEHGENCIWAVAFSPDGETLASASADSSVKLWGASNLDVPRELGVLRGHTEDVVSVAFSPDGTMLVTAGGDADGGWLDLRHISEIKLWDVGTQRLLVEFDGHTERVWYACFSPDGKTLATSGRDCKLYLWDVAELLEYGAKMEVGKR
jgi:WD40 repeat protein